MRTKWDEEFLTMQQGGDVFEQNFIDIKDNYEHVDLFDCKGFYTSINIWAQKYLQYETVILPIRDIFLCGLLFYV